MDGSRTPATLADVAERAGVSRQTVSNAINNPDLLRADTLARVRDAIEVLDYTPNQAARHLRTRSSHLIGMRLVPVQEFTASATTDRFVHALVGASREAGYHVLLFSGGPAAEGEPPDPLGGYDDLLRSTAVDAFVVTDTYLGSPQTVGLTLRRAPFVAFGRPWDDAGAAHPWVDVDGAAGVQAATEHLRGRGHERIAWIGWQPGSRIGEDRRAGWHRTMVAGGLSTTGLEAAVDDTVEAGREAAATLLDTGAPTAFVCASDTLAVGVLRALGDRGLRPGRDIGVVGFDDSPVAQMLGLTSVRQPLEEVAVQLVAALRALLSPARVVAPGVLLEPRLEVRCSTAP